MIKQSVVNFSELSHDKKAEFFNFLLNNNIKFTEGEENYFAKVTLQSNQPQGSCNNKQNRKPQHSTSQKHHQPPTNRPSLPVQKPPLKKPLGTNPNNNIAQNKSMQAQPLKAKVNTSFSNIQNRENSPHSKTSAQKARNNSSVSYHGHTPTKHHQTSLPKNRVPETPPSKSKKDRHNLTINDYEPRISKASLSKSKSTKHQQKSEPPKRRTPTSQNSRFGVSQASKGYSNTHENSTALTTSATPKSQKGQTYEHHNMRLSNEKTPLEPYLRIFKITELQSRPTRWPRHQINKSIQELYNSNFTKNTVLLKSKKFKEVIQTSTHPFADFIIEYYCSKFKTRKLVINNIVNMVSSLQYHLSTQNRNPSQQEFTTVSASPHAASLGAYTNLRIFSKFILKEYEYHDLVYFLFIRSVLEKEFNLNMEKLTEKKQRKENSSPHDFFQHKEPLNNEDFQVYLSKKQVTKYLKSIVGSESELVSELQLLVFSQMAESISLYDLLSILIQDYHTKRKCSSDFYNTSNNHSPKSVSTPAKNCQNLLPHHQASSSSNRRLMNISTSSVPITSETNHVISFQQSNFAVSQRQKTNHPLSNLYLPDRRNAEQSNMREGFFNSTYDSDAQELTFGEDTLRNIDQHLGSSNKLYLNQQEMDDEEGFWTGKNIEEFNAQDELQSTIFQKMNKKVKDLVQIMMADDDQTLKEASLQLYELVLKKSCHLIECIFQMDKLKWFKELQIGHPSSENMEYVERLQLMLRQLRKNPQNAKLMSDFCKNILTTPELKRAIEKIVVD